MTFVCAGALSVCLFRRTPGPLRSSSGMNSTPAFSMRFVASLVARANYQTALRDYVATHLLVVWQLHQAKSSS